MSESARARQPSICQPSIAIVGAGLIGLSLAWRLARRGADVTLFDRGPAGCGASHAAAGMLAACSEAEPGEEALVALCREGQRRWPAFAAELEAETGLATDLRTEGTLLMAPTADERARLSHQLELQRSLDLPAEWLTAAELRRREPHLGHAAGAVFCPQDHQVDNRKVVAALRAALARRGVSIRENEPVAEIATRGGGVSHLVLASGERVEVGAVVLAAGAWSRQIAGIPKEALPPVRPIKGQMLALQMDPEHPILTHVLWAPGAYLVPRLDGRLLIGATVEERGFDARITAGGLLSLLEAAWRVLPGIEELPLIETWVGHRPGSRDDAPIVAPSGIDGLIYATGHHRNGVLLTPLTADAVAGLILDGALDPAFAGFGMDRFAAASAA
jgi:glycine oxidase